MKVTIDEKVYNVTVVTDGLVLSSGGTPPIPTPIFSCTKCSATFTTQALLDSHIATVHPVVPAGKYSAQLARSINLNMLAREQVNPNTYGYYGGANVGALNVPVNADLWYLIEPKGNFKFQFTDFQQGDNLQVWLIAIDANANNWPGTSEMRIPLSGNTGGASNIFFQHTVETRYLVNVKEVRGLQNPMCALYWWPNP